MSGILLAWILLALAALVIVTAWLHTSLPVFTVLWLVVALTAILSLRDPARAGFCLPVSIGKQPQILRHLIVSLTWKKFVLVTMITLFLELVSAAALEPWSQAYTSLVRMAVASEPLDGTFSWLVRFPGWRGFWGMGIYSGLVTLFAEELLFRGFLLQTFLQRVKPAWAILFQAALFAIPNAIAALAMPPLQGNVFVLGYAFLCVGLVGGWSAWRTGSIFPSLITQIVLNLVLSALALAGR